MPTRLFDIPDRAPVFHPQEIQGIAAATLRQIAIDRWNRAVATAQFIDLIRAGKVAIGSRFAQPTTPPTL